MALITVVKTGLKIAQRLSNKYKYLDLNQKFIQKYVPPGYRGIASFATETLVGGGLLYQIVDFAYIAIQNAKQRDTTKPGETRDYMEQPGARRKYGNQYNARYRGRCIIKKPKYRGSRRRTYY